MHCQLLKGNTSKEVASGNSSSGPGHDVNEQIVAMADMLRDHQRPCASLFGIFMGVWTGLYARQASENQKIKGALAAITQGRPPAIDSFTQELRELRSKLRSAAQRLDEIDGRLNRLAESQDSAEKRLEEAKKVRHWSELTVNVVQQGMAAMASRTEAIEDRMRAEMQVLHMQTVRAQQGPHPLTFSRLAAPPAPLSAPNAGASELSWDTAPPPFPRRQARPSATTSRLQERRAPTTPARMGELPPVPQGNDAPLPAQPLPVEAPGPVTKMAVAAVQRPRVSLPPIAVLTRYESLVSSERASAVPLPDTEPKAFNPEQEADAPPHKRTAESSKSQYLEAGTVEEEIDQLTSEADEKGDGEGPVR